MKRLDNSTLQEALDRAGIRYFTAEEILFKGASHFSGLPYNTAPPAEFKRSLVAVAQIANFVRNRFGGPLRVVSAYRSPAYNRAVGGADGSFHMKGRAIDLAPVQSGKVADLHRTAKEMLRLRLIPGGVGFYPWGIHVDTGPRRNW